MGYWLTSDFVLLLVLPTHHTRRTTPYIGCTPTTNHTNHANYYLLDTRHSKGSIGAHQVTHRRHYFLHHSTFCIIYTPYTTVFYWDTLENSVRRPSQDQSSFGPGQSILSVLRCGIVERKSVRIWSRILLASQTSWETRPETISAGQAQEGGQDTASRGQRAKHILKVQLSGTRLPINDAKTQNQARYSPALKLSCWQWLKPHQTPPASIGLDRTSNEYQYWCNMRQYEATFKCVSRKAVPSLVLLCQHPCTSSLPHKRLPQMAPSKDRLRCTRQNADGLRHVQVWMDWFLSDLLEDPEVTHVQCSTNLLAT